jgi:hypothetical protein
MVIFGIEPTRDRCHLVAVVATTIGAAEQETEQVPVTAGVDAAPASGSQSQIAREVAPGGKQRDPLVATSPIRKTLAPGRNGPPVATKAIRHRYISTHLTEERQTTFLACCAC